MKIEDGDNEGTHASYAGESTSFGYFPKDRLRWILEVSVDMEVESIQSLSRVYGKVTTCYSFGAYLQMRLLDVPAEILFEILSSLEWDDILRIRQVICVVKPYLHI